MISLLFARQIVAFFTSDAAVQEIASTCLRLISLGNLCYAWGMVLVQAFNGAGDTKTPSAINFFCYWCFQIPLAWSLAIVLHWGAERSVHRDPGSRDGDDTGVAGLVPPRGLESQGDLAAERYLYIADHESCCLISSLG